MGWRNDWGMDGGLMWHLVEFVTRYSGCCFIIVCGVPFRIDALHSSVCYFRVSG
jgi:hypothetical protein